MGRLNALISFVRRFVEGVRTSDVQVDAGGRATVTADHASTPGDDSFPLPGDTVITIPRPGSGRQVAIAYMDTAHEPRAEAGEKRIYARKSDGTLACAIWLLNTGDTVFETANGSLIMRVAFDGTIHLGDQTGTAPMSRADRNDAEIQRIWSVLTGFTPSPGDGGTALKTLAASTYTSVQPTAADKVFGT